MSTSPNYQKPGAMVGRIMNPIVLGAMRLGISVWGSRILEVRGRSSGLPRRTPVNLLRLDGHEYLVSPRGETQWVRNIRADSGRLALLLGRRRDERLAAELEGDDKLPVLRAYLRKWKMEAGAFFDGVSADSDDGELRRVAPAHPVFVLSDPRS